MPAKERRARIQLLEKKLAEKKLKKAETMAKCRQESSEEEEEGEDGNSDGGLQFMFQCGYDGCDSAFTQLRFLSVHHRSHTENGQQLKAADISSNVSDKKKSNSKRPRRVGRVGKANADEGEGILRTAKKEEQMNA